MFTSNEYWAERFDDVTCTSETVSAIEFDDCTFSGCDFSKTNFAGCRFVDCRFVNCEMGVVRFSATRFEATVFSACKVSGIDWTLADYSEFITDAPCSFDNCVLDYGSFYGLNLEQLKLTNCRAVEVDFREATLKKADFSGSDLRESLFRNTDVSEANFSGASNYTIDLRVNTITGATFSREEALCLLESLSINLV